MKASNNQWNPVKLSKVPRNRASITFIESVEIESNTKPVERSSFFVFLLQPGRSMKIDSKRSERRKCDKKKKKKNHQHSVVADRQPNQRRSNERISRAVPKKKKKMKNRPHVDRFAINSIPSGLRIGNAIERERDNQSIITKRFSY